MKRDIYILQNNFKPCEKKILLIDFYSCSGLALMLSFQNLNATSEMRETKVLCHYNLYVNEERVILQRCVYVYLYIYETSPVGVGILKMSVPTLLE